MDLLSTIGHRITQGPTLGYAILILALILAPRIAEVLRLPAMVGLVLAGMALGPHGLHVLATKEIALSALGEFGLLYLMFSAGLELDLKLFMKMKRVAITFALLSFAMPFTLGIISAKLLSYKWAAAVLMGSNWGSHTLVTYPLLREMGLSRNRAVATVVGATAVTDTSALLVLSVVSGIVKPAGSLGVQILMAHGDVESFERILIVVRRDELVRPGRQDVELAAQLAARFGPHLRIGTVTAALDPVRELFASASKEDADRIETGDPIAWIKDNLRKTDLPFFAGLDSLREAMARVPALGEGRFLVAIAAHETTFHKREEAVAGPVVVGRSLKPHPA